MLFHLATESHTYVLFNGGRGSGKTTAGALESIRQAVIQEGEGGIVVAPTYPMLKDASMREFFRWLPREWIRSWHKTDKLLTLDNGSEIAFRSADNPDALRGPNRAWAWLDEPRNLRGRETFDIVTAQLRRGTTKVWLTTTPAGIYHWLYTLFLDEPLPNSMVISARMEDNPKTSDDFKRLMRSQYTGTFAAQELDAEWVSFEGRIYDNFSLKENVTAEAEYNPDLPVEWGVDDGYAYGEGPGKSSYHPRVFLLGQETPQGGVNVFAAYYQCGRLAEQSIAEVRSWPYKKAEIAYVDSAAAELKARIWDADIQTVGATHAVVEGIKNVRRMIGDGNGVRLLRIHPRCTDLIRELQLYRYDDASKQANAGEPKPLKVDDHGPDALRYLCWHLRYGV